MARPSAKSPVAPELYVGPGAEVRAEFDVPADLPGTDLHADRPVFWEVVVHTARHHPGAPLVGEAVLVPVYRRPRN